MGDGPTHRDKNPIGQDLNIGTIIQLGLGSRASHNYLILPLYPCYKYILVDQNFIFQPSYKG